MPSEIGVKLSSLSKELEFQKLCPCKRGGFFITKNYEQIETFI